jgi:metal-responsive CopG/Arc/MetJ family transcriptional regulator
MANVDRVVKGHGIALSDRDLEKLDAIREAEQIPSRSELVRRLIDRRFEVLKRERKTTKS